MNAKKQGGFFPIGEQHRANTDYACCNCNKYAVRGESGIKQSGQYPTGRGDRWEYFITWRYRWR